MTPASESLLAFTITMNRMPILRLDLFGQPLSRRPSSTRRACFYAADMSGEIILEVIVRPAAYSDLILFLSWPGLARLSTSFSPARSKDVDARPQTRPRDLHAPA